MSVYLDSLFSLQGRVALITGGTRGIGQTMALALAKAGADLVLIQVCIYHHPYPPPYLWAISQRDASNQDTADEAKKLGRRVTVVQCDLADKQELATIVQKMTADETEGGLGLTIDILVNCGGIQRRAPAEQFTSENWDEVLQVNLNAVFTLSRDIINIASLLSYQGGLTVPAYAAAKHGVFGLIKALSNEWSSKGINVNGISPGYIATEMNTALIADPVRSRQILERIPAQRWGSPTDFEAR
ncbi:NAD-binding protein [Mycena amicta]|nr:NAD-binding protein [Mycena amicta]